MRMRKKKYRSERMDACENYLLEGDMNQLKALFESSPLPASLEIGCGKGGFLSQTALKNPDKLFLGLEKNKDCLLLALEKSRSLELSNIFFLKNDARELEALFPPKTFETIYLNFSDPWPKPRYEKRRLTHDNFLKVYHTLLKDSGSVVMKTDNKGLFDFSLKTFPRSGFDLSQITYDLHSENDETNIETEYESKFSSLSIPICRLIARKI